MSDTKINDGGPAFPIPNEEPGMTLRDYFAIRMLPEVVRQRQDEVAPEGRDADEVRLEFRAECAVMSYSYADAMLKARAA